MKLSSTRELDAMRPVLNDKNAPGPDPVYWVFGEISDSRWVNITIITSGLYDGEYPKTFVHYHGTEDPETYHLIEGEGVLVMQKKHVEGGVHVPEIVDEVYLIKAKAGDEILITPEWGHSWSNVGNGPLISFDDWRAGHTPADYEPIKRLQGLAYYLVEEGGAPSPVVNPNYKNLPEPKWVTPEEFRKAQEQF